MMTKTAYISQADHYRTGGFGHVLRSSGIFYFRRDANFTTTVTFMNYWSLKRGLEVTVVASLRDMSGKLIRREILAFDSGDVMNFSPEPPSLPFEGSVEIEVFALKDMGIPFAAIIGVYETPRSTAFVHSYARCYYPHEIEEGRTITTGEESCWTLRDGNGIRSFAVFHNGNATQEAQTARLRVQRTDGSAREVELRIPELAPFQTWKVVPAEHIDGLDGFLAGSPANGALSFTLANGFTRMLIGNERVANQDLQITHSNFNYSKHKTNQVKKTDTLAYMKMPDGEIRGRRVRVYPDADVGEYVMLDGREQIHFSHRDIVDIPAQAGTFAFRKREGGFPTRLVTAIVGDTAPGFMPFELSLGILHEDRPGKRMWWAPTACDEQRSGRIIATTYPELYGAYAGQDVCIRLYSARRKKWAEKILSAALSLDQLSRGIAVADLFPDAADYLAGEIGWFTWYSEYMGFQVFTRVDRKHGTFCMEHGF